MSFICIGNAGAAGKPGSMPVVLPVTLAGANADTYVAEPSPLAGQHREGAGGGVSGSGGYLHQVGGIAAAVDGYNPFDGTSNYYNATPEMLSGMLNGGRWTMLWNVKDWIDTEDSTNWSYILLMKTNNAERIQGVCKGGRIEFAVEDGANLRYLAINKPGFSTWGGWIALWYDGERLCAGLKDGHASSAPQRWEDFDARCSVDFLGLDLSGATWATQTNVFGSSSGKPHWGAGVFVCSRLALGVPEGLG